MNPIAGLTYCCNRLDPIVRDKITPYVVAVLATFAGVGATTLFAVGGFVPVAIGLSVTAVVLSVISVYLANQTKGFALLPFLSEQDSIQVDKFFQNAAKQSGLMETYEIEMKEHYKNYKKNEPPLLEAHVLCSFSEVYCLKSTRYHRGMTAVQVLQALRDFAPTS